MKCLQYGDLPGLLTSASQQQVNNHLKKCPRCREMLREYRQIRRFFVSAADLNTKSGKRHDCIDPLVLLDYLENNTTRKQADLIQKHFAVCDTCTEELIRLQDFIRMWSLDSVSAAKSRVHKLRLNTLKKWFKNIPHTINTPWQPAYRWVAAAVSIIIVGLTLWISRPAFQQQMILRDQAEKLVIEMISPDYNESLDKYTRSFQWTGPENILSYNFILLDDEGDILFEQKVNEARIRLPNEVILEANRHYFWQVEASLLSGYTLRSEMKKFIY